MAKVVKFRRNTTAGLASVTGQEAELFVDTTKKTVVVMDGLTPGGSPLARESALNVLSSSINTINSSINTINSSITTLSSNTWRVASSSTLGLVRPDNSSIVVNNGVLSLGSSLTQSWTFTQSSNGALYLYFGGVAKFRFDSSGTITAVNDVIASGTI